MLARIQTTVPRCGAGTPVWLSRLTQAGFAFFLVKGLAWLALGLWALY